jgi:hypothetical protein
VAGGDSRRSPAPQARARARRRADALARFAACGTLSRTDRGELPNADEHRGLRTHIVREHGAAATFLRTQHRQRAAHVAQRAPTSGSEAQPALYEHERDVGCRDLRVRGPGLLLAVLRTQHWRIAALVSAQGRTAAGNSLSSASARER